MNSTEVHAFATRLMREVWEPFDSSRLAEFYHEDVVGHHRTQTLTFADIENRLAWDRNHIAGQRYVIGDVIAEDDKFSIRFHYTARIAATNQPLDVEVIYFYHLRDGRIAEFWLLASIDFDYKELA